MTCRDSDQTASFAMLHPHYYMSHKAQLMSVLTPQQRKDVPNDYEGDPTEENLTMNSNGDVVPSDTVPSDSSYKEPKPTTRHYAKKHTKRARRHARKPVIRRRAYRAHKNKRVRRRGTKRVRKNKRNHRNYITTKQHQQINNQIRKDRRVLRSRRAKRNKGYRNSILKAINKLQKSLRK